MSAYKCCLVISCTKPAVARGLCSTHYKRSRRHGDVTAGRAPDWGDRHGHPLYSTWKSLSRLAAGQVCEEWRDFWRFASDVVEKPIGSRIQKIDPRLAYGPQNWFWLKLDSSLEGSDKRAARAKSQREYSKRVRSANKDYFKNSDLKRKYGITITDWQRMYDEQGGVCKICGNPETKVDRHQGVVRSLSVDHCHETSKVRGLLCSDCNTAIGLFKHSELFLIKALEYCKST